MATVRPPYGHRTAIVIFETSRQLLYSLSLLSAAAGLTFAWGPELKIVLEGVHTVYSNGCQTSTSDTVWGLWVWHQ